MFLFMDYNSLGLKIGIELHQELSGHKLFCRCTTDLTEQHKITEIRRKMRTQAGELGDVDVAASFEKQKDRLFTYSAYEHESCLVDLDEEPIHAINPEALRTALRSAAPIDRTRCSQAVSGN